MFYLQRALVIGDVPKTKLQEVASEMLDDMHESGIKDMVRVYFTLVDGEDFLVDQYLPEKSDLLTESERKFITKAFWHLMEVVFQGSPEAVVISQEVWDRWQEKAKEVTLKACKNRCKVFLVRRGQIQLYSEE